MALSIQVQPRGGELIGRGLEGLLGGVGQGLREGNDKTVSNRKLSSSLDTILQGAYGYDPEKLATMSLAEKSGAAEMETIKSANQRQKLQEDILKTQLEAAQRAQRQQDAMARILSLVPGIAGPATEEVSNPEKDAMAKTLDTLRQRAAETPARVADIPAGATARQASAAMDKARLMAMADQRLDQQRLSRMLGDYAAAPDTVTREVEQDPATQSDAFMSAVRSELKSGNINPDQFTSLMTLMGSGKQVPPGMEISGASVGANGKMSYTYTPQRVVKFGDTVIGVANNDSQQNEFNKGFRDVVSAVGGIDKVLEMSKDLTWLDKVFSSERAATIDNMLKNIRAAIRTEIIGPGAVSDAERAILEKTVANPASIKAMFRQFPITRLQALRNDLVERSMNSAKGLKSVDMDAVGQLFGIEKPKVDNFLMP